MILQRSTGWSLDRQGCTTMYMVCMFQWYSFIQRRSLNKWEKSLMKAKWSWLFHHFFSSLAVEVSNVILPHFAVLWWDSSAQNQTMEPNDHKLKFSKLSVKIRPFLGSYFSLVFNCNARMLTDKSYWHKIYFINK